MPFPKRVCRRVLGALAIVCVAQLVADTASAHVVEPPTSPRVTSLEACPTGGRSEYADSWGDRRSGGRRHEGVDMAAERGTPVLAVHAGEAEFKRSNLGGNAIWLVTPSGERFYYAHLDAFEGSSRSVSPGEVIGYVGSTGNAGGNHLHFETRLGDVATNPYSLVQSACAPHPIVATSPITRALAS